MFAVSESLDNLLLVKNPTARKVHSVKKCFPLLHKTGSEVTIEVVVSKITASEGSDGASTEGIGVRARPEWEERGRRAGRFLSRKTAENQWPH